jgi:L-ascorbate metabolism protein UlaG (beta-lactamase superfamily)
MMDKIHSTHISENELGIFWLWQNTFILKGSTGTLLSIDPHLVKNPNAQYIGEPPIEPEELQVDYVFCTHDHWDHADPRALPLIAKSSPKTKFLGTHECRQRFLDVGIPTERTLALDAGVTVAFEGFSVTPLYSVPPKVAARIGLTTHFGYVFDFGCVRLYNFGDSTPDTVVDPMSVLGEVAKYHPEIAIFPIVGDYPARKPEDAVTFARTLKPKVVIPGHYGCFTDRTIDPNVFLRLMATVPDIETVIIRSGDGYIHKAGA